MGVLWSVAIAYSGYLLSMGFLRGKIWGGGGGGGGILCGGCLLEFQFSVDLGNL